MVADHRDVEADPLGGDHVADEFTRSVYSHIIVYPITTMTDCYPLGDEVTRLDYSSTMSSRWITARRYSGGRSALRRPSMSGTSSAS